MIDMHEERKEEQEGYFLEVNGEIIFIPLREG